VKISYKPLWHLLLERDMKKMDLLRVTGISTCTFAKLSKDKSVRLDMLLRIRKELHCRIGDIVEFVEEKHEL
jgi:putative transcriptional regulator